VFELSKKSVVKNRDSLPTNGDSLQRWAIASAAPMLYNVCSLVSTESIHAAENPNQIKSAPRFSAFIPLGGTAAFQKAIILSTASVVASPFFSPMCFSLVDEASAGRALLEF
jgi:hypothetical protein